MLEGFVRDALFLACFLICYCMFSCLFDMADPWKTMKNHRFSWGFLIFLGVGDVVRILKQHSICIKSTYQKRIENPWIWHVLRGSGYIRRAGLAGSVAQVATLGPMVPLMAPKRGGDWIRIANETLQPAMCRVSRGVLRASY